MDTDKEGAIKKTEKDRAKDVFLPNIPTKCWMGLSTSDLNIKPCRLAFGLQSGLRNSVAVLLGGNKGADFLDFGFVSAQSQAAAGMLLRQSLAKTQKFSLKTTTLFLKTL
jgi:hypothetical protein